MKDLIRKLLREGLEEAYPSGHFKDESYIERISGAINYNPSGKYLDWRKLNKEHFNTEYHKNGFTLEKAIEDTRKCKWFLDQLLLELDTIKSSGADSYKHSNVHSLFPKDKK